ncbi:hypothetical protein [Eubacterium sp.]|uniref:hypothetical protein n=1 Tax=Eubacterium sp. TaxID=142586 RepID=UPI001D5080F7|nr:hypothetical protein [Eubacterium sp.]MBS5619659.1 hypothetical protein [Eubacterium sp.]
MVNADKLIITEIDQITCFNNANELEFIMDEVQEGSVNNTQDKEDITGRGGRKIGSLKKNKGVTISATSGVVVAGALAAQTGTDVEHGTFKVRKTEIVSVENNKATITGTPVGSAGSEIGYVYIKEKNALGKKFSQDATASATGKFAFSGKDLTFFESDIEDETEIVVFYDEEVESAKVSNDSEKYSKVLKMYIDVTAQDTCDNLYHGQFIVERADFNGEFELSMGGDPTVHSIEAESLAGGCSGSSKLWDFIVYE